MFNIFIHDPITKDQACCHLTRSNYARLIRQPNHTRSFQKWKNTHHMPKCVENQAKNILFNLMFFKIPFRCHSKGNSYSLHCDVTMSHFQFSPDFSGHVDLVWELFGDSLTFVLQVLAFAALDSCDSCDRGIQHFYQVENIPNGKTKLLTDGTWGYTVCI